MCVHLGRSKKEEDMGKVRICVIGSETNIMREQCSERKKVFFKKVLPPRILSSRLVQDMGAEWTPVGSRFPAGVSFWSKKSFVFPGLKAYNAREREKRRARFLKGGKKVIYEGIEIKRMQDRERTCEWFFRFFLLGRIVNYL